MRIAFLTIIVFGTVLVPGTETRPQCTCVANRVNISAQGEFELADAVFVGKIVAVNKTPPDIHYHYVESVTFKVETAWKQDLESSVTIVNKILGCANGFAKDEKWLVYVYKRPDGTLGSLCCCTRTTNLAKAQDDLEFLAKAKKAKVSPPK